MSTLRRLVLLKSEPDTVFDSGELPAPASKNASDPSWLREENERMLSGGEP